MDNTRDLFNELESKYLESRFSDEYQNITVRLTPESGLMLKAISSEKVLNFPVSTTFTDLISKELFHLLLLSVKVEDNRLKLDDIMETYKEVSSNKDYIKENQLKYSFDYLYDLLEKEVDYEDILGLYMNDKEPNDCNGDN